MDLFEREQRIFEKASCHADNVRNGAPVNIDELETIAKEYGKLLKYVRRVTRFSDRNTFSLLKNNLDLNGKVHNDPLTGIYNRRFLEENLRRNIKELSRSGSVMSVAMLDVDFFKKYNDTYGHNEGDVCLQIIGKILLQCITREDDFVARYGGEEFVIVLPHADEYGARLTAERVLEKMLESNIPHAQNEATGCVTVSIGVTTIKVKHTHKITDYIKCVDEALYMSKQNGRNRYTYKQFMEEGEEQ